MKQKGDTPINRQCFRYWVELRDLRDGTVRELPVTVKKRISLAKPKSDAQMPPPEIRVLVQDGERSFDAPDVQDLARQLRERYPVGRFECTLKWERDREAEEKRRSALEGLMRIVADAVVERELSRLGKP